MSVERVGESMRYVRLSTVCLIVAGCLSGCSSDVQEQGEWQVRDRVDVAREEIDVSVTPDPEDGGAPEVAPSCEGAPDHDVDSDFDGLSDCEERLRGCVDPHTLDTDGDRLGDGEEDDIGSDPCSSDSDGDGVDDFKELLHGLDPLDPTTYDGVADANLFMVRACDVPASLPNTLHEDHEGDWVIVLPPQVNYTSVVVLDAPARVSSAVYDDPTNEVAGFVERAAGRGAHGVGQAGGVPRGHLGAVGTIYQDLTEGEFDTHDGHKAAPGEYFYPHLRQVGQEGARRAVVRAGAVHAGGGDGAAGLLGQPVRRLLRQGQRGRARRPLPDAGGGGAREGRRHKRAQ